MISKINHQIQDGRHETGGRGCKMPRALLSASSSLSLTAATSLLTAMWRQQHSSLPGAQTDPWGHSTLSRTRGVKFDPNSIRYRLYFGEVTWTSISTSSSNGRHSPYICRAHLKIERNSITWKFRAFALIVPFAVLCGFLQHFLQFSAWGYLSREAFLTTHLKTQLSDPLPQLDIFVTASLSSVRYLFVYL